MPMALPSPGPIFAGLMQVVINAAQDGHEYLACRRANQLDNARTIAAERAIEHGATHILYLDADHVHPPTIVADLLAHDVDVVGGLNYTRKRRACALPADDERIHKDTGLRQCLAVGTGSLLVRTSVFERIKWPWFYFDYSNAKSGGMWEGEDTGFCRRCEDAGIEIWCDTGTTSPHLDTDAWVG